VSECERRDLGPLELSSYHETLVMQFPASCTSSLVKVSLFTLGRITGGEDVQFYSVLISAADGGEWSTSRPDRFTPAEEVGELQTRAGRFWRR
jgi:hypothetical protein